MIEGREFFSRAGEPETSEEAQERKYAEEQTGKELSREEKDPILTEILDKVNFDKITGIPFGKYSVITPAPFRLVYLNPVESN